MKSFLFAPIFLPTIRANLVPVMRLVRYSSTAFETGASAANFSVNRPRATGICDGVRALRALNSDT